MRTSLVAFVAGVAVVGLLPALPKAPAMLWIALLLWAIAAACRRHELAASATVSAALAGFCLGIAWHADYASDLLAQRLPAALEGRDLTVTGTVVSLPELRPTGQQFRLRVDPDSALLPGRTLLLTSYEDVDYRAGQRWQLTVRLKQPHGLANPGTLDYEGWLFQHRLSARGYVRQNAPRLALGQGGARLARWREALRDRLAQQSAGLSHQWLFLALTLGDRSGVTDQHWEVFSKTGTNHLVVISGLHIGLIAGLCKLLVERLWRVSISGLNHLPAQQAGAVAALIGSVLYSLLAGFGLPAQRATTMVAVFMIAQLLGLRSNGFLSLSVAAVVVLLINPVSVIGAGFWLSFCAVAGLLLVFGGGMQVTRNARQRAWRGVFLSQWVVALSLLVPMGVWQGSVSVIAPLANAAAIPLVGWVLVPLCLLGSAFAVVWPAAAGLVFGLAEIAAGSLFEGLAWLVQVMPAQTTWQVDADSWLVLGTGALGSVLMLVPLGARYRLLAALMLLPLLTPIRHRSSAPLTLHVLDVGQGLAIVVRTPGHTLVYDTGAKLPGGFDTGEAVVAPVLQRLGVRRVDRLIVSHADNDHAGGAPGLLAAIPVDDLLLGEPVPGLPDATKLCVRGQSWQWDEVRFRILHPRQGTRSTGNDRSCVLELSLDGLRVLLPGDVESASERLLLAEEGDLLPLTVLVSAHHGSGTSSSWSFLARTRPGLVIHSAGYRNQFGHPAATIRERYQAFEARQLLTAEQGMVSLTLQGGGEPVLVTSHRQQYRRYWHWSAATQPTGCGGETC